MKGVDVITFQIENEVQMQSILSVALRQAIIESTFCSTSHSISESIHANFERNVALGLFRQYASIVKVPISWKPIPDFHNTHFDFKWNEKSFLLMNKMVRGKRILVTDECVLLPALVPNRFDSDRWPSRQSDDDNDSKSFLFTFLHNDNFSNHDATYYGVIPPELAEWLALLKRRFNNSPKDNPPYTEEWFWSEASRRSGLPQLSPGFKPSLIITGVCLPEHYSFFSDTDGLSEFAYALYTGKWYEVESPGVLSFCNGAVLSKFKNATCPMTALPSFSGLMNG